LTDAVVPVHWKGDNIPDPDVTFPFVRFTIANLKNLSEEDTNIYWLHFAVSYLFVVYALMLLWYHYEVRPAPLAGCATAQLRDRDRRACPVR
jgi:hypothetical protein